MMVDKRKEYDKFTKDAQILEELPYRTFLATATLIRILVVASRQIVFTSQLIKSKETGCLYTPTFSIDHDDVPVVKDPVRALVHIGGWVIMPRGTGSQVIYAAEINPGGSIPTYLIEKTADIQVLVIAAMRDYMIKIEGSRPPGERRKQEETKTYEVEKSEPLNVLVKKDVVEEPAQNINQTTTTFTQQSEPKTNGVVEEDKEEDIDTSVGLKSGLSKKEASKYQTPEELEMDVSFCNLTDADTIDPILNRTDLPEADKEYLILGRKIAFDLLKEINGPYKKQKPAKKIGVFTRDNDKGMGNTVLGIGELPFNIETVAEILLDEKQRKNFDDMLQEGTILKQLEHMTFLFYITFKRVLILSPRDFVCCGSQVKFKNGIQVFPVTSIELDDQPENKKFIRASLFIGGFVLIPKGEDNTLCYYYNRADMKGTIPEFVLKQGATMQALLLHKLREYMIKKEKKAKK